MFSIEEMNFNFTVIISTWPGIKPTIYDTQSKYVKHNTKGFEVNFLYASNGRILTLIDIFQQ